LEEFLLAGQGGLMGLEQARPLFNFAGQVLGMATQTMNFLKDRAGSGHGWNLCAKRFINSNYTKKPPVTRTGGCCLLFALGPVEEALKLAAANRMLQLADRLGFDLANAFPSYLEDAAHLFEGVG